MEVLQSLMEPCDRATYGERLREAKAKTVSLSGAESTAAS